jgi:hypothetical protein
MIWSPEITTTAGGKTISRKWKNRKNQINGEERKREGFTDPHQSDEGEEGQALFLKTSRSARTRLGQFLIR